MCANGFTTTRSYEYNTSFRKNGSGIIHWCNSTIYCVVAYKSQAKYKSCTKQNVHEQINSVPNVLPPIERFFTVHLNCLKKQL